MMIERKGFNRSAAKVYVGAGITVILLLSISLSMIACNNASTSSSTPTSLPTKNTDSTDDNTPAPAGPISAVWIEPEVDGDTISIPRSEVDSTINIHFKFEDNDRDVTFMAYKLDSTIFVRANECPPCRSIGYSLDGNTLVCDRCHTVFDAVSGEGVSGACVDYPKAPVSYQVEGGNIIMSRSDLVEAYDNTLLRGWP